MPDVSLNKPQAAFVAGPLALVATALAPSGSGSWQPTPTPGTAALLRSQLRISQRRSRPPTPTPWTSPSVLRSSSRSAERIVRRASPCDGPAREAGHRARRSSRPTPSSGPRPPQPLDAPGEDAEQARRARRAPRRSSSPAARPPVAWRSSWTARPAGSPPATSPTRSPSPVSADGAARAGPALGGSCTNGTAVDGQPNIIAVHEAVCATFPEITTYGTYRSDGEHAQGLAIDIMVSGSRGWEVAEFVRANYSELRRQLRHVLAEHLVGRPVRRGLALHGGPWLRHREPLRPRARHDVLSRAFVRTIGGDH